MRKSYPVAAFILVCPGISSSAEPIDQVFTGAQDEPGCSMIAARHDEILARRAYGLANIEHREPLTPDSVFDVGSIAKQVVAGAVMLLVLDGELSLNDDIRKFLPELPDYGSTIRVRHLLHHTSGLRDWLALELLRGPLGPLSIDGVLEIIARQKSLNFQAGGHYLYSNTDYTLLALVVTRVSGQSFMEFTRERFFGPLNMTTTAWRTDPPPAMPNRSNSYRRPGDEFEEVLSVGSSTGSGGLLSTAEDLIRWTQNLETGELGGDRFVSAMRRKGTLDDGSAVPYAGGLALQSIRGHDEEGHGGLTAGYRSYLLRYPVHGISVAVLCNNSIFPIETARQIADVYLPSPDNSDALAGMDSDYPPRVAVGNYRNRQSRSKVSISVADGHLLLNGVPYQRSGEFEFQSGRTTLIVVPSESGVNAIKQQSFLGWYDLDFIGSAEWSPDNLDQYTGHFKSEEADLTLRIHAVDETLIAQRQSGEDLALVPVADDEFASPIGTLSFYRDSSKAVSGLVLSNDRVWGLVFQREELLDDYDD